MTDKVTTDRRSVLKTAGGVAASSVLGSFATGAAMGAHDDSGTAVRVNQVGYTKDAHKIALVTSEMADVSGLSSFEVQDASSGETAHSGSLSAATTDELGGDSATGHTVKQADFSDLTTAGEYTVVVDDHESRPFRIGSPADVYGDLLADVGRLYTLKRANADIDDPETGLDIGPGHMQDRNAVVAQPTSGDWLTEHGAGDEIDVTGGWYDAGDYGKYVVTHAVTAAQLMLAYERNPDAFAKGQFDFPSSLDDPDIGEMPDVLAEVKYGMEFLTKMQRSDGALFFKVAGDHWPNMTTSPSGDDMTRYVFGLSSAGTAMAVGAFAMAARVFQEHDPDYADRMLGQAEAGFQWLQNNPNVVWETSDSQNQGSGAYDRSGQDASERYWAAAELLRTTGDSTYEDYVRNDLPQYTPAGGGSPVSLPAKTRAPIDWNDTVSLGHYAYAKTNGQGASTAQTAIEKAIWVCQRYMASHTRGVDPYTTGLHSYYWGDVKSGVSRAVQCVWAADMGSFGSITDWTMEPLHHALGRSATGYSYVSDYGELSTQNPHDRILQSQNRDAPIPGMLVGGPHNNLWGSDGSLLYDTSLSAHVSQSTPHAMSYLDAHDAYPVNEWAINYTAPLFMALAETGITAEATEPTISKPANLSVTSTSSSSVTVSWDAVDGAEEYTVSVDGTQRSTPNAGTTSTTIEGLAAETAYTVTVAAVAGNQSAAATVTATTGSDGGGDDADVEPIDGTMPRDIDGDGEYEDFNGNGRVDSNDVVTYFQHRNDPVVTDHVAAYDYNDSGRIDYNDIVALFQER